MSELYFMHASVAGRVCESNTRSGQVQQFIHTPTTTTSRTGVFFQVQLFFPTSTPMTITNNSTKQHEQFNNHEHCFQIN